MLEVFEKGDFVAVSFSGEDESTVFLPFSGDIMLASKESVSGLAAGRKDKPPCTLILQETLRHLGADSDS